MTKVSSSKKMPKPAKTSHVTEQEKSSTKTKKIGSEIDEIFGGNKRKRLHVTEQEKSSSKTKKMGSEIDEIFGGKKRKNLEEGNKADSKKQKPEKVFAANNKSHDKIKIGKNRKSNSFEENSSKNRSSGTKKRTADGLTIYTEEELGFGKADAGGTKLCPFDCDCCF